MSRSEVSASKYRSMRIQCISRAFSTSFLPTTGMLFSAWQAITQALHPTHALLSIAMPQAYVVFWNSG